MSEKRVLVITGMHRSGTSLVASMAQHAGVAIGDDLLGPNAGNPRGYFEDAAFYHLHRAILRRFGGQGPMVQEKSAYGWPNAEERRQAEELLDERRGLDLWGWKDPRTALFLDFWDGLLGDARYLFVYRRPLDVVLSLQRSGTDLLVIADPVAALNAWTVYNRCLLDFQQRHPDRSLLCEVDGVVDHGDRFLALLQEFLGVPLEVEGMRDLVAPGELGRSGDPPQVAAILRAIAPRTAETLERLKDCCELPASAPPGEAALPAALATLARLVDDFAAGGTPSPSIAHPALSLLLVAVDGSGAPPGRDPAHVLGEMEDESFRLKSELEELHADYEKKAQWALELDRRLRATGERLLELQEEFDECTLWAFTLDKQVAERDAQLFELQAELARRS